MNDRQHLELINGYAKYAGFGPGKAYDITATVPGEPYNDPMFIVESYVLSLSHHGGRGGALVLPVGGELAGGAVVPREAVDAALDEDEAELRVLVLAVALQVLANLHGLLDEHVQVLGDLGGEAVRLEDANDLLPGDAVDLGDAVGVAQDDADLGGGEPLLGELAHLILDVEGGDLAPARGRALVGAGALGDALAGCVHASHAVFWGMYAHTRNVRETEKRNKALETEDAPSER
ncbi:hypothetical protein ACHAW5_006046 [Stephanodiscus triporus]|uniref:Uncharacterized protein n=1 Tax=Stephanodiscus triporus TaxID=2934178 RepID=A0ABD3Q9Z2_9STRA